MTYQKCFFVPFLMLIFGFFGNQAFAQEGTNTCSFSTSIVGEGCVGACGETAEIQYQVGPICSSTVEELCLGIEASDFCDISHGAFADVYVDGVLVASGNIAEVGSLSFNAACGSTVTAIVKLREINPNVGCIPFGVGNLNFALRI